MYYIIIVVHSELVSMPVLCHLQQTIDTIKECSTQNSVTINDKKTKDMVEDIIQERHTTVRSYEKRR